MKLFILILCMISTTCFAKSFEEHSPEHIAQMLVKKYTEYQNVPDADCNDTSQLCLAQKELVKLKREVHYLRIKYRDELIRSSNREFQIIDLETQVLYCDDNHQNLQTNAK